MDVGDIEGLPHYYGQIAPMRAGTASSDDPDRQSKQAIIKRWQI